GPRSCLEAHGTLASPGVRECISQWHPWPASNPSAHLLPTPSSAVARKKPVPSKATATEPSTRNVVAEARGTARKAPPTYTWQQNLKSVLWAVGLFLFLRIFLIQAFRIPSESM